ncbi:hypothetical protein PR202_ga12057 [Eleusine coracana subsp. coracana]|uniref:Protein kinase domain-containing protein n=1 Tax=Eleusine coracana subsp. coracana TaxID=191504 RepID=A0AAV5CB38_ELECO|nr:hypothetical protein PR202_ga12057 [Eleusine coracana subsp. coracana]
MDDVLKGLAVLESILDGSEKPRNLPLAVLRGITQNFSEERKIGQGGCGDVYMGILRNGAVAVKKLFSNWTMDDKMFHQEVTSMMLVNHPNTVRFLGLCSYTEEKAIEMDGKVIIAEDLH